MAIEEEDNGGPETPEWIVTFTDLMSLLLTFFILLLTFSTPQVERLFELRGSIRDTFGIFRGPRDDRDSVTPPSPIRQGREHRNPNAPAVPPRFLPLEERDPNETLMRLRDQSGEAIIWERINEGYRIFIRDAVLFAPGEESMSSDSFSRLARVARALEHMPHRLVVVADVGTDERSLLERRRVDPMDLAIRRAVALSTRLVREHGVNPARLAVAGYGPDDSTVQAQGQAWFIITDERRFGRP